ncbi:hypothetical protein EVAR_36907_1 [Eumeta japonica]|uniref:Uncharacterized protein n=1 Tax=Eumeta variegata TaxID=151549 RepID=A0A4C1WVE6_EUMVA|nr:hypothetical protein EVAR_36907_1 [Eumeta japonica]
MIVVTKAVTMFWYDRSIMSLKHVAESPFTTRGVRQAAAEGAAALTMVGFMRRSPINRPSRTLSARTPSPRYSYNLSFAALPVITVRMSLFRASLCSSAVGI